MNIILITFKNNRFNKRKNLSFKKFYRNKFNKIKI